MKVLVAKLVSDENGTDVKEAAYFSLSRK